MSLNKLSWIQSTSFDIDLYIITLNSTWTIIQILVWWQKSTYATPVHSKGAPYSRTFLYCLFLDTVFFTVKETYYLMNIYPFNRRGTSGRLFLPKGQVLRVLYANFSTRFSCVFTKLLNYKWKKGWFYR